MISSVKGHLVIGIGFFGIPSRGSRAWQFNEDVDGGATRDRVDGRVQIVRGQGRGPGGELRRLPGGGHRLPWPERGGEVDDDPDDCRPAPTDSGEIKVCGFDTVIAPMEVKRRIGYVPEFAALYQALTPNEYLSLIAELHHIDRGEARRRIADYLRRFELAEAADGAIEQLSKGMRQKVLIIGAVLHDPDVLLLDEPLNGLDVNAGLVFRRLLEEMLARGKTILFSSHIFELIERLCSRVIIIDHGLVVADEPTRSLLSGQPGGTLEAVFQKLTRRETDGEVGGPAPVREEPSAPSATKEAAFEPKGDRPRENRKRPKGRR